MLYLVKKLEFSLFGSIEEDKLNSNKLKFWNLNWYLIFYFFNTSISITIKDRDFLFETYIQHVPLEGSVSQNLYLVLSFLFYAKNGQLLVIFSNIYFYIE